MSMNSFHARDKRRAAVHVEEAGPKRERERTRADTLLVEQGLAVSRAQARKVIEAGRVTAGDARVTRASQLLPPSTRLEVMTCKNNETPGPPGP